MRIEAWWLHWLLNTQLFMARIFTLLLVLVNITMAPFGKQSWSMGKVQGKNDFLC